MLGEVRKHKSVWTQGAKAGKQFTEQRVFRKKLHDILVKLGAILFFSVIIHFCHMCKGILKRFRILEGEVQELSF